MEKKSGSSVWKGCIQNICRPATNGGNKWNQTCRYEEMEAMYSTVVVQTPISMCFFIIICLLTTESQKQISLGGLEEKSKP